MLPRRVDVELIKRSGSSSFTAVPWITARSFRSFCSIFVKCTSPACSSARICAATSAQLTTSTRKPQAAKKYATHLCDLLQPFLVDDGPLDAASLAVSLPRRRDGANKRPELVQLATHPARPTRSADLLIDIFQRCAEGFFLRPDRGRTHRGDQQV